MENLSTRRNERRGPACWMNEYTQVVEGRYLPTFAGRLTFNPGRTSSRGSSIWTAQKQQSLDLFFPNCEFILRFGNCLLLCGGSAVRRVACGQHFCYQHKGHQSGFLEHEGL